MSNDRYQELNNYIKSADLLNYDGIIEVRTNKKALSKLLDTLPKFAVDDSDEEFKDMMLMDGGSVYILDYSNDEDAMPDTMIIAANDIVFLPVASINGVGFLRAVHEIYVLGRSFAGHHKILVAREEYRKLQNKCQIKKNKGLPYTGRKVNMNPVWNEFYIDLLYDEELQEQLVGKSQEELFEFFDTYKLKKKKSHR